MVIIKEVELGTDKTEHDVVVQVLESIPENEKAEILTARRVVGITFCDAKKEVGNVLSGIIITAPCEKYTVNPSYELIGEKEVTSEIRTVYVEHGDKIINLEAPVLHYNPYDETLF